MERKWFDLSRTIQIPTPGIPCLVRTKDGKELWAIRPSYISSYSDDPNFLNKHGEHITDVIAWAIY